MPSPELGQSTSGSHGRKAFAALVVVLVILAVVFGIRSLAGGEVDSPIAGSTSNSPKPKPPVPTATPPAPVWKVNTAERIIAQVVGGNDTVVAMAMHHAIDRIGRVTFLDAETGEPLSSPVQSPSDNGLFGSCALLDSGTSAACVLHDPGRVEQKKRLAFIDVRTGVLRKIVEVGDGFGVFAVGERFFGFAAATLEVFDPSGAPVTTLPADRAFARAGYAVAVESRDATDGSGTVAFVVHRLDTLTEVFRHELASPNDRARFSPFADGFAFESERGVAYLDADGSLIRRLPPSWRLHYPSGFDPSRPLGASDEPSLPALVGPRSGSSSTRTVAVADPQTGKLLWQSEIDNPSFGRAAGDTIEVSPAKHRYQATVRNISTGSVLATGVEVPADCIGAFATGAYIATGTGEGTYELKATTPERRKWLLGPYRTEPVSFAGKIYADAERIL